MRNTGKPIQSSKSTHGSNRSPHEAAEDHNHTKKNPPHNEAAAAHHMVHTRTKLPTRHHNKERSSPPQHHTRRARPPQHHTRRARPPQTKSKCNVVVTTTKNRGQLLVQPCKVDATRACCGSKADPCRNQASQRPMPGTKTLHWHFALAHHCKREQLAKDTLTLLAGEAPAQTKHIPNVGKVSKTSVHVEAMRSNPSTCHSAHRTKLSERRQSKACETRKQREVSKSRRVPANQRNQNG